VQLSEGRNREVRRLFEAINLRVSRLIRTSFGPLRLPRELRQGRWREIDQKEVRALLKPLAA
jgi:23S rRNA pseudouridine2605 synthase